MDSMETPKKPGIMARLRNRKGFSLIEMAIVLVIIGIIIAAIVKGQDLMVNSRAKQLVATANAWKIATYGFMDRNGKFPGDAATATGFIDSATTTAIESIATTMSQAPANPVLIGGQSWYFYLTSVDVGSGAMRNVILVCTKKDCTQALSNEDVEMLKALDTAIDGSVGAGNGQIRSLIGSGTVTASGTDASGGRATTTVAQVPSADISSVDATGDATKTWSTGNFGAIWFFDKPI